MSTIPYSINKSKIAEITLWVEIRDKTNSELKYLYTMAYGHLNENLKLTDIIGDIHLSVPIPLMKSSSNKFS